MAVSASILMAFETGVERLAAASHLLGVGSGAGLDRVASLEVEIRRGFAIESLKTLRAAGVSLASLAAATDLAMTTLKRRLCSGDRFDAVESDRILRFAVVVVSVQAELNLTVSESLFWLSQPLGRPAERASEQRLVLCANEAGMLLLGIVLADDARVRDFRAAAAGRPVRIRRRLRA